MTRKSLPGGIVQKLLAAGLTTILIMGVLWMSIGSILLLKAERATERRMAARKVLVLILQVKSDSSEFLSDFLLDPAGRWAPLKSRGEDLTLLFRAIATLAQIARAQDQAAVQKITERIHSYEESFSGFLNSRPQLHLSDPKWVVRWDKDSDKINHDLETVEPLIERLLDEASVESDQAARSLRWVGGFIFLISLGIGWIVFYSFAKSITRPLLQLTDAVHRISSGDQDISLQIPASGEVAVLVATFKQMLEHLGENQAALVQSEKMAGIGQFAAGVAHDINNPIGVILGFTQALIKRFKEEDPLMMPLKSIERETLRCKTLVQSLLAFSRSQKHETSTKPENLSQVLEQALALVTTMATQKKMTLTRAFAENLPPVSVDAGQIQQVVINLCTNAMDAMPEGGQLTVGLSAQDSFAEISVRDNGSGISPEIRSRIFDPFFTTKDEGKGTGLGLSLIATIVKNHNGRVDLESVMGQGSTFTVKLPLFSAAA